MFIDYSNPDNVVIKHKETINTGKLYSDGKKWWLHIQSDSNYYPFNLCNVAASSFIENILGYSNSDVTVRSKEDLIKVLDALNKEYERQFCSEEYINLGLLVDTSTNNIIADKDPNYYNYYCGSGQPLTPSESISNISIKTFIKPKKHYKLNFNN